MPKEAREEKKVKRAEYAAPGNPVEEVVAEIWEEVLEIKKIGLHDSFFDLGGNSLHATRVMSRLHSYFQVEMTIQAIFETVTLEKFAGIVADHLADQVDELDEEEARQLLEEEEKT